MSDTLGRYRLLKLLATGGMGEVFLARQEGPAGFAKTVVVKRILRHLAQDQGFIDLFLNEAQMAAQLQHPHIAQVFGLEHEGQTWFIAMEYVHGRSVRDLIEVARDKGVKVPPVVAARLASQALQGLQYAHQLTDARGNPLGILHRDVTPDNLLVAFSGVLKLVDFGIARAMTGAVTRVGRPKGKVGYMAPELTVSGAPVDCRADLYGVGVVLYEMLTLARPPNVPTTADAVSSERRPYRSDPAVPPALNAILARAMAPNRADRFPSAQAMSEALEAWLVGEGQTVLPGDITAFLVQLYGRETVDANPSVLPLEPQDQAALGGTQPLMAAPLGTVTVAVAPVLVPVPRRRRGLVMALLALGLTAVGGVILGRLALWPPSATATDAGAEVFQAALAVVGGDAGAQASSGVSGAELAAAVNADASEPIADGADDAREPPDVDLTAQAPDEEAPDAGLGPERRNAEPSRQPTRLRRRRPATGRVALKVSAGAEVFYGRHSLGITPMEPVEVPSGTATFVLRHRKLGVTRKVSVRVPPGGTVVLRVDLSTR